MPPQTPEKAFSYQEIVDIATDPMVSLRDRALFTVLYLTNSRVSEIVRSLRKDQVQKTIEQDVPFLLFFELPTEKNKDHPLRIIPVNMQKEAALVRVVQEYSSIIFEPKGYLFDMTRQRAWQIIKRMSGQRCHYLRHSRLSHLSSLYNMSTEKLKLMAGWRSENMTRTYIHLQWKDLVRNMV